MKQYRNAVVKFNNGNGALLCNQCCVIIAYGFEHKDVKHYCPACSKKLTKQRQVV